MSDQRRLIANRYQIEDIGRDLLGQGGMGAVYRALDTQTGEWVALKRLKSDAVINDPEQVARFIREGKLLRQLDHPNIVKMLATAVDQDDHYIIMEYVTGGSLRELLNVQPQLPQERVLTIGLELADALARAHHLQIIHRDIKPGNVLLTEEGFPRLTDFGLAHAAGYSQITQAGALAGTYAYLSPEVCGGQPPDGRADIWSFGVMLYEMLAGKNPFDQQQVAATLTAVVNQPLPDIRQFRPDLPETLINLISQMVVKDRDHRLNSARVIGAALESIRDGGSSPSNWGISSAASVALKKEPRHNLPNYANPFLGRKQELTAVAERLADPGCRLLTILGPGGVGKSRLAIEAAQKQIAHFQDGVFRISLAAVASPTSFIPTLAEAINFTFYQEKGSAPDLPKQIVNYLREKNILLLLDNFEGFLDDDGLIADILAACPQVKILATSSQRLNLQEEWALPLAGLPLPPTAEPDGSPTDVTRYEAVQLFSQCAARVAPNFNLAATDGQAVAEICRLVGGIPLGIELAAAWTQLLSPQEILAEIRESFDFLQTDLVNVPERHRSLRAAFAYSWARLTAVEKQALRRLSIFQGSFTREAAGAVALDQGAAALLSQMSALLNKSLLKRIGADRYQIHELLRQYVAQKLAEDSEEATMIGRRHAIYYAAFLRQQQTALYGSQQKKAAQDIEAEIENVRAAWQWIVAQEDDADFIDSALGKAQDGLALFYRRRNWHQEGAALFEQAVAALRGGASAAQGGAREASPTLAYALVCLASFYSHTGKLSEAAQLLQESETLFAGLDLANGRAETFFWQGKLAYRQGDFTRALDRYERSLAIFRELDLAVGLAKSLAAIGGIAAEQGDYEQASSLYEECLAIRRGLGDRIGVAETLNGLAVLAYRQGRATAVQSLAKEGLAIYRELDHQPGIARILQRLAMAAGIAHDYQQAIRFYRQSMTIFKGLGDTAGVAGCLINLNHNFNLLQEYETGREYGLESVAMIRELQNRTNLMYALNNVGHSSLKLGDYGAAKSQLREALTIAQATSAIPIALEMLGGMAELCHADGQTAYALEILACVRAHPALIEETERLLDLVEQKIMADLAPEERATAVAAAQAAPSRSVEALITAVLAVE